MGIGAACGSLGFPPRLITIRRHRQLSSVCTLERAAFEAGSGELSAPHPRVGTTPREEDMGPPLEGPLC